MLGPRLAVRSRLFATKNNIMIKIIPTFKRGFYDFCLGLLGLTCMVVLMLHANEQGYPKTQHTDMLAVPALYSESVYPSWADELPLGSNIWKASQPEPKQLAAFLVAHKIRYVIRLNGNQEGSMTHAEEAAVCAAASKKLGYQITFIYVNIEAKGDRLNPLALKKIRDIATNGDVLIHCLHGYHRAGVGAGLVLADRGLSLFPIIDFLDWTELTNRPGHYARYVDAVVAATRNQSPLKPVKNGR